VVTGRSSCRHAIMKTPEPFVSTVVQKLMTYALGRGLSGRDMAVVREIVRDVAKDDYRFSVRRVGNCGERSIWMRRAPVDGVVASDERASGVAQ